MSLRVALAQIQLKSWQEGVAVTPFPWNEKRRATIADRRKELLQILRAAGKPVSYSDLVEQTGWTIQTTRGLAQKLIEDGSVERVAIEKTIHLKAKS